MRNRIWKKLAALTLAVMVFCCSTISAYAESVPEGCTSASYAEDTSHVLARGSNLSYGSIKITAIGKGEVSLYGLSQCYHSCSKVYLELYLEERDSNGDYYTIDSWSFTEANADHCVRSISALVAGNNYYRLRGYHAARDGGIKESTTTMTSGIWVD